MSGLAPFAAVIGWPAAHSISPVMMTHWLEDAGLAGVYGVFEVPPERFNEAVQALANIQIVGLNVTVPHKQAALDIADEVSPAARTIGAANLLTFDDGRIHADNTDIVGIEQALEGDDGQRPAVLIGAGGAARAAAFYLSRQNCPVRIINRTVKKAKGLSDMFDLKADIYSEICEDAFVDARLVINASSRGMAGKNDLIAPLDVCAPGALVFDMVYSPLETRLLADARRLNLDARDGLLMLMGQARPSFEAFFGAKAPESDNVRDLLIAKLGLKA
jgi:shikimate dehydrogenase